MARRQAAAAGAGTVLAPVLREAVTNILRHSTAMHCTMKATSENGTLWLSEQQRRSPKTLELIDGSVPEAAGRQAAMRAAPEGGGSGLANLTASVPAVGGRLTASHADGRFGLTAEIPAPRQYRQATRPGPA